jgi:hypothetical protein
MREIVIHSKDEDYTILIDDEDFQRFSEHTWHILHNKFNKYCQTDIYNKGKRKTMRLHRFILGLDFGDKRMINHKNGDGLDNRKSNLEICDNCYNSQSLNTKRNFGYIYINKRCKNKYNARVIINKKRYNKYFYTREEAELYLDEMKQVAINETKPFD